MNDGPDGWLFVLLVCAIIILMLIIILVVCLIRRTVRHRYSGRSVLVCGNYKITTLMFAELTASKLGSKVKVEGRGRINSTDDGGGVCGSSGIIYISDCDCIFCIYVADLLVSWQVMSGFHTSCLEHY